MKAWRLTLTLMLVLAVLLTACGGDEEKQDEQTSFTIGVLTFTESMNVPYEGFKAGLAELGFTEGDNVTYMVEMVPNTPEDLLAGANKLVEAKVDLILALATPATIAAKEATAESGTPVVFTPINDPVGSGIVSSLTGHNSNLTGVRVGGFVPKEFEWLLKIDPEIKTVFAPHNPNDSSSTIAWEELVAVAESAGVEVLSPEVTSPEEVVAAFEAIPDEADAIFMAGDAMVVSQLASIVPIAIEKQLPTASFTQSQAEAGVLMTYGFDFYSAGQQTARLASQILKGVKPQELPVETSQFFLTINLVTADASGVTVGDDVLSLADNIIRPE